MAGRIRSFVSILLVVLLIGGTVGVIIVMGASREQPERAQVEPRGLAVFVEQAQMQDVALKVSAQGEARPRQEINLVPQVSGLIVETADSFRDGGTFEQGDMLLRIEDADYELAVTRAAATVAQAQRALERERAEAEIAKRDWDELGDGEATSLTLREPQLAEARAALAGAQASLRDARLQLERTVIRAPFDGRIREKMADVGQFVSPGQALARAFSTDVVEVRLPLSDDDLALLNLPLAFEATADAPGPQATLTTTVAGRERFWSGEVTRTDSAVDARTRTLSAIVEVADPYGAGADGDMPLAVGLFVKASIVGREIDDAFVVPRAALRGENEVYVANVDGTMDIRVVDVISTDRERAVLASGVFAGDYVVVSPVLSANQGMALEAYSRDGALLFPERDEDDAEDGDTDEETDDAEPEERADALAANADDAGDQT